MREVLGRGITEAGDHLADPDPAAEGGSLAYHPHRPHLRRDVPQLAEWRAAASRLDPAGVFRSDLGQRLGLRQAGVTSPGRQHAG